MTEESRGMQQRLAGPSRRAVLAATGLAAAGLPVLLAACRGVQSLGTPPPAPHDIRVLRAAITSEEQLIASCSAALTPLSASGQTGATALTAVRSVQAEHVAHLAQLRSRLVEPSPQPTPSTTAVPPNTGPPTTGPPASSATALQALEQAEQAASDQLMGQLGALPPALAQLLASIAASEATHVPFLRQASGSVR